jgi:hypothetical protein
MELSDVADAFWGDPMNTGLIVYESREEELSSVLGSHLSGRPFKV